MLNVNATHNRKVDRYRELVSDIDATHDCKIDRYRQLLSDIEDNGYAEC